MDTSVVVLVDLDLTLASGQSPMCRYFTMPRSRQYLQLCSPEVQPARGGESTANLCHAKTDERDEEGDEDPAPDSYHWTSRRHTESKERHDANEDGGIGQREAKVLETRELAPF